MTYGLLLLDATKAPNAQPENNSSDNGTMNLLTQKLEMLVHRLSQEHKDF